jgi:lipopolysaccharide assembly protein A
LGREVFPVRWLYLAIVVVFVAALIIFVFQNTESVSVSFLSWAIDSPIALVVVVIYVLGALTGGSLYGLLRRSVAGVRR